MPQHAFIVGGGGQIGVAIATALLAKGWRVTLASRNAGVAIDALKRRGAAWVRLDRDAVGALDQALPARVDALIDTVAFDATHASQLLAVQGRVGALVVISSSSVYRDSLGRTLDEARECGFPDFPAPIRETQPTVEPGPQTYSTRKMALEQTLLNGSYIPVIILRPGALYGPFSTHPREWWFVKRMLDQRPVIPLAYGGRSRFHTCASANLAALVAAALERPRTGVFNAADSEALDVLRIAEVIARRLGYQGQLLALEIGDDQGHAVVGNSPWSIPAPFTLDMDAPKALGYQPVTDYAGGVGDACDWLLAQLGEDWRMRFPILAAYPWNLFDYDAEDDLLGRWPNVTHD